MENEKQKQEQRNEEQRILELLRGLNSRDEVGAAVKNLVEKGKPVPMPYLMSYLDSHTDKSAECLRRGEIAERYGLHGLALDFFFDAGKYRRALTLARSKGLEVALERKYEKKKDSKEYSGQEFADFAAELGKHEDAINLAMDDTLIGPERMNAALRYVKEGGFGEGRKKELRKKVLRKSLFHFFDHSDAPVKKFRLQRLIDTALSEGMADDVLEFYFERERYWGFPEGTVVDFARKHGKLEKLLELAENSTAGIIPNLRLAVSIAEELGKTDKVKEICERTIKSASGGLYGLAAEFAEKLGRTDEAKQFREWAVDSQIASGYARDAAKTAEEFGFAEWAIDLYGRVGEPKEGARIAEEHGLYELAVGMHRKNGNFLKAVQLAREHSLGNVKEICKEGVEKLAGQKNYREAYQLASEAGMYSIARKYAEKVGDLEKAFDFAERGKNKKAMERISDTLIPILVKERKYSAAATVAEKIGKEEEARRYHGQAELFGEEGK